MTEVTDPAWEMKLLIERLRTVPSSTEPTWKMLPRALNVHIEPSEHWELMSALNSRLVRLEAFIKAVQDKEFDEAQRKRMIQAVNILAQAFKPEQQVEKWQDTLAACIREDDALHLRWFSIIAKRYRPLRQVNDDERDDLIAKIEQTLLALKDAEDIPDWAKAPLSDGLSRLRFTLQHLVFFGSEEAIDQLLDVYNKTVAIEAAVANTGGAREGHSRSATFEKVLNWLVIAATVFWLPDQTLTAFERYQGWYLKVIVENPRLPKPERRLLAPPVPEPSVPSPSEIAIAPEPPRVEPATEDE